MVRRNAGYHRPRCFAVHPVVVDAYDGQGVGNLDVGHFGRLDYPRCPDVVRCHYGGWLWKGFQPFRKDDDVFLGTAFNAGCGSVDAHVVRLAPEEGSEPLFAKGVCVVGVRLVFADEAVRAESSQRKQVFGGGTANFGVVDVDERHGVSAPWDCGRHAADADERRARRLQAFGGGGMVETACNDAVEAVGLCASDVVYGFVAGAVDDAQAPVAVSPRITVDSVQYFASRAVGDVQGDKDFPWSGLHVRDYTICVRCMSNTV